MNKFIVALVVFLSVNSAVGAEKTPRPQNPFAPPGKEIADVPLTAASIQRVIASFGRLRAEFKDYQPSGDAQDMQHYMRGNEAAFRKGEAIVREAGFDGWPDWSGHFAKVMQTYMAHKMRETGKVNPAQLEQQMRAVQDNPGLTAEQKQMALDMIGMAGAYTQMAASVPEKDLQTLEPFIGQLEQVMKSAGK